ncbi:hypothetical protein GGI64_001992 [Rhizobium leguminosarum]|uniref:Uncharacterized protein n=1 Tax=Rhizobium leguminosarum TaxID=384 RepID=A0A7Z0DXV8_RHILE|nr:hypothetical protein [Rhizobium leguminosarum]
MPEIVMSNRLDKMAGTMAAPAPTSVIWTSRPRDDPKGGCDIGVDANELAIVIMEADRRRQVRRHFQYAGCLDGNGEGACQLLGYCHTREFADVGARLHFLGSPLCRMGGHRHEGNKHARDAGFQDCLHVSHVIPLLF